MLSKANLLSIAGAMLPLVSGQQRGTISAETHPSLMTFQCTKAGGCAAKSTTKIVLDANWRWLHGPSPQNQNCFPGSWDSSQCPDPQTCARNCALEGADYASTYGITASGQSLELKLFPPSGGTGSRVYLLGDDENYQLFRLLNQEFSFDVDVSGVPCGANGALYFSNMPGDGGKSATNRAGAYMGTGYCDAQCPRDMKFINGEANLLNWNGAGKYGSCCPEFDVWEANSASTAVTAHPCSRLGLYRCDSTSSTDCAVCDQGGCDFNPYRQGNASFYGPGQTVATNPGTLRVVTQFLTADNTTTGALAEVRRLYIRGGKLIQNSASRIPNVPGSSLTDAYCAAQKAAFAEPDTTKQRGGLAAMGRAMQQGMVLTMSVWLDYAAGMRWLDSTYPDGASGPGTARGPCATNSGDYNVLKSQYPNAKVVFSNIRVGDIGTTYPPPLP